MIPYIQQNEDGSIYLTAPVMIPGRPDCDYGRGEPPLTHEQVKKFMREYESYRLVDSEHEFTRNGNVRGFEKESFLLTEPTTLELYDGSVETYPADTWVMTSHVTDPEAVSRAMNGLYTGYSVTVRSREVADKYMELLRDLELEKAEALKSESLSGLIKDVHDPVVLSVSLVKKPCQSGSKICKIRSDKMTDTEIKRKVLNAMGMSDAADVEALKSQVESFDTKLEELKKDNEEALKSMKEDIISEVKSALVEFADKSEDGSDEEEEEPEDTEEEIGEEIKQDDEQVEADKGSKQGKIHNGEADKGTTGDDDTYEFLGRYPDGTRKSYDY